MKDFTEADLDAVQMKPRKRGTLPDLPERDAEMLRSWLTRAFKPPDGWAFDTFERPTTLPTDGCSLTFRNGRDTAVYRFEHQRDLMGPRLRSMVLSIGKGDLAMPHLTASEIEDVWAALCTLGSVLSEWDERDDTRHWVEQMLPATTPLAGFTLVPDGRRAALIAIKAQGEFKYLDARALVNAKREDDPNLFAHPTRFIDAQTGEHWLRVRETATYIRWVLGVEPLALATLKGRLHDIGVEAQFFQDWHPPHPKAWLYRLTDELVEGIGAQ